MPPGSDRAEGSWSGTARGAATIYYLEGFRFPEEEGRARRPVSARVGELDMGGVGGLGDGSRTAGVGAGAGW